MVRETTQRERDVDEELDSFAVAFMPRLFGLVVIVVLILLAAFGAARAFGN